MAAVDACPDIAWLLLMLVLDINAAFNVPTSFKILTCFRLLWGARS